MGCTPRVTLTNADKVLYPAAGTTKRDVFDYYTAIAEVMLPHIAGRPVTRKRWPDGVEQEPFFEKQLAPSAPAWLPRAVLQHRAGAADYPLIDDADGLAWIAQQAALEVHVPQWRYVDGKPGPNTRLVFDLDPGQGVPMSQLAQVARAIRDLMADLDLTAFPVTSGSKGLHLYVALDRPVSSESAVLLAKRVAQQLESEMPTLVTATMTRSLRAGRVFVDWSQNNASKTTVAPYSLRGRAQPTVAAPRSWAELDDPNLRQLRYDEVLARVAHDGDLLAALDRPARSAFAFGELFPMLATQGTVIDLDPGQWAFEGKWDGYRMLVEADRGTLRLRSRNGREVTGEYPQLASLGTDLAGRHVVLDGEAVALDAGGVPRFSEMQNHARAATVQFWAFDLLYLDGRSLLRAHYRDRRRLLEALGVNTGLIVHPLLAPDGAEAMQQSRRLGWEGVVAKRWDSGYQPRRRSRAWIKAKHWRTQEVVIGGWSAGAGGRDGGIGSLLMGIPGDGGLTFVGKVGTGFAERDLDRLKALLEPLHTAESPFAAKLSGDDARDVTYVRPEIVAEVRYGERTTDGRLRQPSWRGLRPDKAPDEVVREE
ncbi:non-homologous end-joining DNA ligase [Mycobacterium sp. M1]|uniref:DNA ligase (ATP) n=1 Tax=Mycolicibacter acidiphilus TaxID=2835306 RepID=A0ABS5RJZ5_9MYCO|nr:non-homologous end-joining DNA ligase [Mycolicibacter acidiphilus]MBS9534601.1 non-homologous end-joining DNA ligase [Mycolicibacter acidiphilus]